VICVCRWLLKIRRREPARKLKCRVLHEIPLFHQYQRHRSKLRFLQFHSSQRSAALPRQLTLQLLLSRLLFVSFRTSALILPHVRRAAVKLASVRSACLARLQASEHQLFVSENLLHHTTNNLTDDNIACRINRNKNANCDLVSHHHAWCLGMIATLLRVDSKPAES
jgi:hypothetical protein